MSENLNVMCVGYLNLDEVIHLDDELAEERSVHSNSFESAGGGATNTSLVLSQLECVDNVWLAGALGQDKRGELVMKTLEDHNVELAIPRYEDIPTTKIRAIVTENHKPRYIHEDVTLPIFSPEDVRDGIWESVDHVHMTTFDPDMTEEFSEKAKDEGATISMNPTQGYFSESYRTLVENADLIQMNRQESEKFRERNGPLGTIVANEDTDVVITHGPAGCTMHSKSGVVSHPGYPDKVNNVVDTIGAGDTFMAGLLSGWLQNEDLQTCLEIANSFGACAVQKLGAPNSVDENYAEEIRD
jgi:sugar/nucleoside kinase (ribokinase family)